MKDYFAIAACKARIEGLYRSIAKTRANITDVEESYDEYAKKKSVICLANENMVAKALRVSEKYSDTTAGSSLGDAIIRVINGASYGDLYDNVCTSMSELRQKLNELENKLDNFNTQLSNEKNLLNQLNSEGDGEDG